METGGNVSIVLPYDKGVFYEVSHVARVERRKQGAVIHRPFYFKYRTRGEQAAEIVLRALEKQWAPQKSQRHLKNSSA